MFLTLSEKNENLFIYHKCSVGKALPCDLSLCTLGLFHERFENGINVSLWDNHQQGIIVSNSYFLFLMPTLTTLPEIFDGIALTLSLD